MENEQRNWLVLRTQPDGTKAASLNDFKFINLAMVLHADEVTANHIRLHFSGNHAIEIHGLAAAELAATLMSRSISPNGTPYPPVDITSESQE